MGEAKLLTIIKTNPGYKLRIYARYEIFLYKEAWRGEMAIKNRPLGAVCVKITVRWKWKLEGRLLI